MYMYKYIYYVFIYVNYLTAFYFLNIYKIRKISQDFGCVTYN